MTINTIGLESARQRLHLLPEMGGAIAAWDWKSGNRWTSIFRSWDGQSDDRYSLACFPLVPWSNRISQGGFEHNGIFYPIRPNREDERYPIHGDGWLQSWQIADHAESSVHLLLESHAFDGNPYHYVSTQTFSLCPSGIEIILDVTHLGDRPLPYGLGLHPYFVRNAVTRLWWKADGVWLSGDDPIPKMHTQDFPPTWNYNAPSSLDGPLIDNCFTGWNGKAFIEYPDRGLTVIMSMAECTGYSLLYRPPGQMYFCLEPITHPIDAFHMPAHPGLVTLSPGQSMAFKTTFLVS